MRLALREGVVGGTDMPRGRFLPGAVAELHPENPPEDVQRFIDLMKWQGVADDESDLVCNIEGRLICPPRKQ